MAHASGRLPTAPGSTPSGQAASRLVGFAGTIPIADEEWTGSKRQREALRAKFDGKCAYCGCELDKMHADHLEPCIRITRDCWGSPLPAAECRMVKPERNTVANMMPACAPCNLHKGGYSLEGWRDIIQRSAAIIRKQTSTFKAGERFGIITVTEQPVRFYFEKLADCRDCAEGTFPLYGVAPHDCFWRKGPEFTIGQSTLIPITSDDCFVPDLNDNETWADFCYPSACGVSYCPRCHGERYRAAWDALLARIGPPPASGTEARSDETEGLGPQGDGPARDSGDAKQ